MQDMPVPPPRSADRVHEQVKAMAVTFHLRPSERINEVELARQLGVSRTPLREALNRLAAEGFLIATANRGYTVRPLDPRRVLTLYEYRALLETGALRLACERASDEALADLAAFAARSRDEPDDDAQALRLLSLDEQFHESLARLSDNEEILRSLRSLNERVRFIRWIDMRNRRGTTQDEHLRIVAHLRRRDADAAAALMQTHIARRLDQISEMIRAGFAEIYTSNALAAQAVDAVA
jgi:DNA-binding GntR family transcriptional regulator